MIQVSGFHVKTQVSGFHDMTQVCGFHDTSVKLQRDTTQYTGFLTLNLFSEQVCVKSMTSSKGLW